jgi:hypothetical protein
MQIEILNDPFHPKVQSFFTKCREYGFENNISVQSIKYNWATSERRGRFWTLQKDMDIVAMAGCHWAPEIHQQAFRIQFRGCELPGSDVKKTLSRGQFNSSTFRELIPIQLAYILELGNYEIFLSVNIGNRNHRAMEILEKQGFLEFYAQKELFYTQQTIWKFNALHYNKIRTKIGTYACMKI